MASTTPRPTHLDQLLTVEEAAAVLAVTPRMVRHLMTTRGLAFVKVGRLVRLRQSDISQTLESWSVSTPRRRGVEDRHSRQRVSSRLLVLLR